MSPLTRRMPVAPRHRTMAAIIADRGYGSPARLTRRPASPIIPAHETSGPERTVNSPNDLAQPSGADANLVALSIADARALGRHALRNSGYDVQEIDIIVDQLLDPDRCGYRR